MKTPKQKYEEITDGWKNLLTTKDGYIITEAKRRADICSNCNKNVFNICIMCGCPLSAKTHSVLSDCDLKKW